MGTVKFLIFDIETRVDKALLRATQFADQALSEKEAYERMRAELRALPGWGGDFVPLSYHVPISIALGSAGEDYVLDRVEVLKADELGEAEVVRAFWQRIEAFGGTLVSFNGRGFDLPVLELQALRFGCVAPRYFTQRDGFRARYGRHLDLYDFLTNSGAARLRGGLDLVARLVGLPGKRGLAGADVQRFWEAGRCEEVHRYCRRDVVQTYFLFLRVEHLRGRLSAEALRRAEESTRAFRAELADDAAS